VRSFATSDALEALAPPEALFDTGASLVEGPGEEGGRILLVGLVWDRGAMPRAREAARFALLE
jgi:hypothetical protein